MDHPNVVADGPDGRLSRPRTRAIKPTVRIMGRIGSITRANELTHASRRLSFRRTPESSPTSPSGLRRSPEWRVACVATIPTRARSNSRTVSNRFA